MPDSMLTGGWQGANVDSPFGQLALILKLQWLSLLLYADAVISPGGSAYVGVAIDARHTYALARNGVLPWSFADVEPRSGIPHKALLLNLAVIVVFLLPYSGWQDVVSVGAWVVAYLVALLVVSTLGSFDGSGIIAAPWDTVLVGLLAAAVYVDAVRSSRRYRAATNVDRTNIRSDKIA